MPPPTAAEEIELCVAGVGGGECGDVAAADGCDADEGGVGGVGGGVVDASADDDDDDVLPNAQWPRPNAAAAAAAPVASPASAADDGDVVAVAPCTGPGLPTTVSASESVAARVS